MAIEQRGDLNRPKRKPDTGLIRPYRPVPANFVEVYLRNGWDGPDGPIEEIFNTNWRVIARWIELSGGDDLRAARSAITGQPQRPHRRSRRFNFAIGRRLGRPQNVDWESIPVGAQLKLGIGGMENGTFDPPGARRVRITDHARLRYLERVVGIDMSIIDAALSSPTAELCNDMGGGSVILQGGQRAIVKNGAVITVTTKPRSRQKR